LLQVEAANDALKRCPFNVPILSTSNKDGYLKGWTLRAYKLDLLGATGEGLKFDSAATMASFGRMNPDRKSHLCRLHERFLQTLGWDAVSPAGFCKALGVERKPELLSFFACFAGDVGFKDSDFEDFEKGVKKWWAFAHAHFKECGVEPHPAIVAQGVRAQLS
jgi:hypothetical protein